MAMMALGDLAAFQAAQRGHDTPALIHEDETVSWGELERRATRRAWGLKAAGVTAGDLVTLALPNGSAVFELSFALWKLGATPHMVSARLPGAELEGILQVARPRLVIAADDHIRSRTAAKGPELGLDGCDRPIVGQVAASWKAMSSGGSTGRPKVIVDHLPSQFDPTVTALDMPAAEAILNPGPLYHNAPFLFSHMALFRGSAVVGMSRFDAQEALRLMEAHGVSWVCFVPTMMHRIWRLGAAERQRYDLSALKSVWHTAAPLPAWLKSAWIEWLGPERIFELYGGTEGLGYTTIDGTEWLAHRGSVGKPVDCEIRILDADGREVAPGEVGEIYLRPFGGAGSTYHYLGAEPRLADDGFESLGDFGWCDGDGYLYIADRRTDLILSGGANIYPAEVEGALMEHPDVEAAVVIGLPDEDLGAAAHAIIRPAGGTAPSAEELMEFLRQRLARYKIPRSFELTQETLRDEAGKVRRSHMRCERLATASRGAR